MASLSIRVVDVATKAPLAGASVSVGASHATTDPAGEATVTSPTGRATVRVSAGGRIAWQRDVLVGDDRPNLIVPMHASASRQSVGASGDTLTFGNAMATIPSGAVADGTQLGITAFDATEAARQVPRLQFETDDQIVHRIVAAASVDISQAPSSPITLTLTIPSDASGTALVWVLDSNGEWSAPQSGTVTATHITFAVSASGEYGVSFDASAMTAALQAPDDVAESVVLEAGSDSVATIAGAATPLAPGVQLPAGSTFDAGGSGITIVDPHGDVVRLDRNASGSLQTCVDLTLCEPGSIDMTLDAGGLSELSNPGFHPEQATRQKLIIRSSHNFGMGVRGTAFTVADVRCPSGQRTIDDIQVYDGTVDITSPQTNTTMVAGPKLDICSNCAEGAKPVCSCLDFDPQYFTGVPGDLTISGSPACPSDPSPDTAQTFLNRTITQLAGNGTDCRECGTKIEFDPITCSGTGTESVAGTTYTKHYTINRPTSGDLTLSVSEEVLTLGGNGSVLQHCFADYTDPATPGNAPPGH